MDMSHMTSLEHSCTEGVKELARIAFWELKLFLYPTET